MRWRFWVRFAIVWMAGLLVAGTGYQHALPYIDFGDEMTIWSMGRTYLDPSWVMFQPQYPPGILLVSSLVQRWQQQTTGLEYDAGGTIAVMRLLSVIAYMITLTILMLLTRRLAGAAAALSAGLCWVILPLANQQAKLATIDPWLVMFFCASVACSMEGWRRRSTVWLIGGLIFALLATVFKWQGAGTLVVAWVACVALWRSDRRRAALLLVSFGVVIAAFSVWVVFIHRALEGGVYLPGTQTSVPTPDKVLINVFYPLFNIGSWAIYGVFPLLGLTLALLPTHRALHLDRMLWAIPLSIVGLAGVISVNGAPVFDRHYLSASAVLCVMSGVGASLLLRETRVRRWLMLPTAVLLLLVGVQGAAQAVQIVQANAEYVKPDRRTIFAAWARDTATEGPLLITDPLLAVAVETIYGYLGRPIDTPYNEGTATFIASDAVTAEMLTAANIRYLIAPPDFSTPHLPPLTRLITYGPETTQYRGETWAAFWVGEVPPLPGGAPLTFGDAAHGDSVHLTGLWLSATKSAPGETVKMRLAWSAPRSPTRYYSFFLHLSSPQTGELAEPINGLPPANDTRPTISWSRPDEVLISPEIAWTVPADVPAGRYELWLGLFEPVSLDYLRTADGKHYHVVGSLEIAPR